MSMLDSRALHRARGLKFQAFCNTSIGYVSRPSPGAWIEIAMCITLHHAARRALHRARGLKFPSAETEEESSGRALHRARGLKFLGVHALRVIHVSRPSPGAWIEIV